MIPSRSSGSALALAVWLALGAAPAEVWADDVAEARRLFARGEREVAAGRFDAALAAYARAHELSHLPGFLFNIGFCHHQLEQWPEAVLHLERYLEEVPDAPNRADAERLLGEARAHLPPPAPPPPASPPPPPEAPAPPPSPPPSPGGSALGRIRAPAWIALGAGAVLGGLAIAFAIDLGDAQSDLDDPSLDCTLETARCHDIRDRGERAALLQVVLGGAGAAALVAAGVFATLDLTRREEPEVRVSFGPGRLSLEGTW